MLNQIIILIISLSCLVNTSTTIKTNLQGAWKSDEVIILFSGNYYSVAAFSGNKFLFTQGGSWVFNNNTVSLSVEYDSKDSLNVGKLLIKSFKIHDHQLEMDGSRYLQIDNGTPGELNGVWLFSTRVIEGKRGDPRSPDNPRKTMKILSGTRFQWIAYNIDTKEFSGTGGGSYTTVNGKYTEKIDFFSRDPTRIGASLEFDYKIEGEDWHHQGLNSRGEALYEIWKSRK